MNGYGLKKIEWNKVTPLSKMVALGLFVALPFIGFYFGVQYGQSTSIFITQSQDLKNPSPAGTATTTPIVSNPDETAQMPGGSTSFSYPYPVSWKDGAAEFSITGVSLGKRKVSSSYVFKSGSAGAYAAGDEIYALTLYLKIVNKDASSGCVPVNIRRVADEEGNLAAPNTGRFALQNPAGACTAVPNVSYFNQEAIFIAQESERSFLITTGGSSNMFFSITKSGDGTLKIEKTATEG